MTSKENANKLPHFDRSLVLGLKLLILLAIGSNCFLIGSGFASFPDEFRYDTSRKFVEAIQEGNYRLAFGRIYETQGRPMDVLVSAIPATFQLLSSNLNSKDFYHPRNAAVRQIFNLIVFVLILFMLYKLSIRMLSSELYALLTVFLYCCFASSFNYIRHALPYDIALLFFLYAFYKILKFENWKTGFINSVFLGTILSLAYLSYPGYFGLFLIAYLFYGLNINYRRSGLAEWKGFVISCVASICAFVVFEIGSRIVGNSLMSSSKDLSVSVVQGSFEESFAFLPKQLVQAEQLMGILLLLSVIFFGLLLPFGSKAFKVSGKVKRLYFLTVLFIFLYAVNGYFFGGMVFYSRITHSIFPFLVIIMVASFQWIKETIKVYFLSVVIILAIVDLGLKTSSYVNLGYPNDFYWDLYNQDILNRTQRSSENNSHYYVNNRSPELIFTEFYTSPYTNPLFELRNAQFFFPLKDTSKFTAIEAPQESRLIEEKMHFISYKTYQFEGYSPEARKIISEADLKISLWSLNQ